MKRLALLALLLAASPTLAQDLLAGCRAVTDPKQRLACYDALPALAAPIPAPAAAPATPVPAPDPVEGFGKRATPAPPPEPASLQSNIDGKFGVWKKGTVFQLKNGQSWRSIDDQDGYYPNVPDHPPVTIRKSWTGAYWMEVEGVGRRIKVQRIQ